MGQHQENKPFDGGEVVRTGFGLVELVLASLALMYRLPFYRPFTMGCRAIGLWTAIGALLAYPVIVSLAPPTTREGVTLAMWGWQAVYVMLMVQFVASKFGGRHSNHVGSFYVNSPLVEAAFAQACAALVWPRCPGVAYAVAGGWLASEIQVLLIKARVRRAAGLIRDMRTEADQLQSFIGE